MTLSQAWNSRSESIGATYWPHVSRAAPGVMIAHRPVSPPLSRPPLLSRFPSQPATQRVAGGAARRPDRKADLRRAVQRYPGVAGVRPGINVPPDVK